MGRVATPRTASDPERDPPAPGMDAPWGDEGVRWMLAWRAGDERAFERLVERYSPAVYALVTRFVGPVPEREDLVQDVFLRVVRSRDRYRPSARFSTFLYTIVFNLAANQRARERLRRTDSLDATDASDEASRREPEDERTLAPDAELSRQDAVENVRSAIAALPDQQRMALILARYDGLSYAEIAEVLGSSEKAIKSLVHRARETLRARLAPFSTADAP